MSFGIFSLCVLCGIFVSACDLQPKITSIPDSVGLFIEDRYPALLADPETQPEIYNSAASDYGVYASPELYGSSNVNDYVLYASVDDYTLAPQKEEQSVVTTAQKEDVVKVEEDNKDYLVVPMYGGLKEEKKPNSAEYVIVAKGDTLYSLAKKNNTSVSDLAKINNFKEPYNLSIGQKVLLRKAESTPLVVQPIKEIKETKPIAKQEQVKVPQTTRVNVQEITVAKGDTLYSLSRKYEIPVNDLAVMNKLSAPFSLSVGQKLKVPMLVKNNDAPKITPAKTVAKAEEKKKQTTIAKETVVAKEKTKISSDPKQKLPQISSRSASKFSWPVRGKILSQYGAKNNGLFNDGINIAAQQGTAVKSAENGVVAYAGNELKGMGNLIIIQHSGGWMTVYAHLDSMSVKRGTKVSVGQVIGKIGMTGKVDKPQLHFEIRKGTKAYNPTQYLKK